MSTNDPYWFWQTIPPHQVPPPPPPPPGGRDPLVQSEQIKEEAFQRIVLIALSQTESEYTWNSICDFVKQYGNGIYPRWWSELVLKSGLLQNQQQVWEANKKKKPIKPKWNNLFDEGKE